MIRIAFGWFYLVAGTVFVGINSFMLWNGAHQVGSTEGERMALGIFGGVLAVYLAAQTVTLSEIFTTRRVLWMDVRLPRMSAIGLWLLFLGVNLITGLGTVGHARNAAIAESKHDSDTVGDLRAARARKQADLDNVPKHRPAGTVQADIDKAMLSKAYDNSYQCAQPKTRDQHAVCKQIEGYKGELAAAIKSDNLQAQIDDIDSALREKGPIVEAAAETQVNGLYRLVSRWGVTKEQISTTISVMWPIALEAGAAYSWHHAFLLLGLSLAPRRKSTPGGSEEGTEAAPTVPKAIPAPGYVGTATASAAQLARERQVVEWFFATFARPVPGGNQTEEKWLEDYRAVARAKSENIISPDRFRRIAAQKGADPQIIDGQCVYLGIMPRIETESVGPA